MHEEISFRTQRSSELVNLTERVRALVRASGVGEGLCIVHSQHTTAGVTLNSTSDPATPEDILEQIDRLVPTRVDFQHTLDTPGDAAAHIKLALVGNSVLLPVVDGDLRLGHSQSILFCEFDGPRDRMALVQLIPSR